MSTTKSVSSIPEPIYHDLYYPRPKTSAKVNYVSTSCKPICTVQTITVPNIPVSESEVEISLEESENTCHKSEQHYSDIIDKMAPCLVDPILNLEIDHFQDSTLVQYSATAQFSSLHQPSHTQDTENSLNVKTISHSALVATPYNHFNNEDFKNENIEKKCFQHLKPIVDYKSYKTVSSNKIGTNSISDVPGYRHQDEFQHDNNFKTKSKVRKIDDVYRSWCGTENNCEMQVSLNQIPYCDISSRTTASCSSYLPQNEHIETYRQSNGEEIDFSSEDKYYETILGTCNRISPQLVGKIDHATEPHPTNAIASLSDRGPSESNPSHDPYAYNQGLQYQHKELPDSITVAGYLDSKNNIQGNFNQLSHKEHNVRTLCSEVQFDASHMITNSWHTSSNANVDTENISEYNDLKASLLSARDEARKSGSRVEEEFLEEWMLCLCGEETVTANTQTLNSSNLDNFAIDTKSCSTRADLSLKTDSLWENYNVPQNNTTYSELTCQQLPSGVHRDANATNTTGTDINSHIVHCETQDINLVGQSCSIPNDCLSSYSETDENNISHTSFGSGKDVTSWPQSSERATPSSHCDDESDFMGEVLDMSVPHDDVQLTEMMHSGWLAVDKSGTSGKTTVPYKRRYA